MSVVPKSNAAGKILSVVTVKARGGNIITKSVCSVVEEEKGPNTSSMPYGRFHINLMSCINLTVVEACQDILCAKGLRSSDGANNFLSNATGFCNLLQRQP